MIMIDNLWLAFLIFFDIAISILRYLGAFKLNGYDDLGQFKITAYVLAQEADFPEERKTREACGLKDKEFRTDFLYRGKGNPPPLGVITQGSGISVDGKYIHYQGKNSKGELCFKELELDCVVTKSGRCAEVGRTVAVDPEVIEVKEEGESIELLNEGVGIRKAEDIGDEIKENDIDVYYGVTKTWQEAQKLTLHNKRVCKKKEKLILPKYLSTIVTILHSSLDKHTSSLSQTRPAEPRQDAHPRQDRSSRTLPLFMKLKPSTTYFKTTFARNTYMGSSG